MSAMTLAAEIKSACLDVNFTSPFFVTGVSILPPTPAGGWFIQL
jgi:hypothetical protein